MRDKETIADWFCIAGIAILVIGFIGWVMNIVQICHMHIILSGLGVIKIIAIFVFPVGAVMGWVGVL